MNPSRTTNWLEIDLNAIRGNVRALSRAAGTRVLAVVKANAYGHGLPQTAQAALQGGAEWLGVARIDEGLALRESGIRAPVLVLGYTPPERVGEAAAEAIRLTVYDPEVAQAYAGQAQLAGATLAVHVKFDTGMGRLGAAPEEGVDLLRRLKDLPALEVEGVFTHLAEADDPVKATTDWQLDRFDALLRALSGAGLRPRLTHAANSAATLYTPRARYDMVRPGIALYGLHPSDDAPLPDGFRAALAWKACLTSVKTLPPGHGVGYNYRYHTSGYERIGVAACGYADGFRRRLGNHVLVGGRLAPVVGGVCMDQIMIQLDAVPEAKIGDEVVIIGRQGDAVLTAEDHGREWGTNNYEVVCGLAARVPRYYNG